MQDLYYATGNSDKFKSVSDYLERHMPHVVVNQCAYDLIEIQSDDISEIAIEKARQAWNLLKKPVLVDDAGIFFEKYHKFPGTMTKYVFSGIGFDGLYALTKPGDKAMFRLSMVYWYAPESYVVFESEYCGTLSHQTEYKATKNSPYNQLFVPNNSTKTLAQMIIENGHCEDYDYRIFALKKLLHWYTIENPA